MLKFYTPNAYALGLNVPLSVLYSITAPQGMPRLVRILLLFIVICCGAFELCRNEGNRSLKYTNLCVISGTALIWPVFLFVYGHIPESSNPLIYDVTPAVLISGVILLLGGIAFGFALQKRQYFN